MTDETLTAFTRQYIEASPDKVVRFTWHGGEPTLASLDFYRRAVALQKEFLPPGRECWNSLQTNGTLLDDEWCLFLAVERVDVGLSIDGTQAIHDKYRKNIGGAGSSGSYEQAAGAVQHLQRHGIQPDLLCTVTPDAAEEPLAVYRTLRELGTGWIQFIPIVRRANGGGVTPDSVSGKAYGDFLVAVFDEWVRNDLGKVEVQIFAEAAGVLSGGTAGVCWMAPACGNVLIVERDGSVYACDHYVRPEYRIGDIFTSNIGDLAQLPFMRRFGDGKCDLLPPKCQACEWLPLCNGACPKDRFIAEGAVPGAAGAVSSAAGAISGDAGAGSGAAAVPEAAVTPFGAADAVPGAAGDELRPLNYLCEGYQRFFSHAAPIITQIIQYVKQGNSPEAIMSNIRAGDLAMWAGIGRNDPCPCGSWRKAKSCCWAKRP
jgi:uncharacterized protein